MTNTISIPAGELKPAIAGLAKIIDPKNPLEALRSVKVEGGENGLEIVGTDSETFARFKTGQVGIGRPFLVPFGKLQELIRRLPSHALVHLKQGMIECDLGTGRIEEVFEPLDPTQFPEEPALEQSPVGLRNHFRSDFARLLAALRRIQRGPSSTVSSSMSVRPRGTTSWQLMGDTSSVPIPSSFPCQCRWSFQTSASLAGAAWETNGRLPLKRTDATSAFKRDRGRSVQKPLKAHSRIGSRSSQKHRRPSFHFPRTIRSKRL